MNLNLGSGHVHHAVEEGWINLDSNPETGCEVVASAPWLPFKSESFDYILASHFIEHVSDTISLMNECWRILKFGGNMQVFVPYAFHSAAFQDPTHVKFFVVESFMYYTEAMSYLKYGIKVWSSAPASLQSNGWVVEAKLTK